jgi:hypothetical protein
MCVFHSSQFTFMTRNQAAQPPNSVLDHSAWSKSALGRSYTPRKTAVQEFIDTGKSRKSFAK